VAGIKPEMRAMVRWLAENTGDSARILFEDQLRLLEPTDPESTHWTPLLPILLRPETRLFIGGWCPPRLFPHPPPPPPSPPASPPAGLVRRLPPGGALPGRVVGRGGPRLSRSVQRRLGRLLVAPVARHLRPAGGGRARGDAPPLQQPVPAGLAERARMAGARG